jgi:hypothetical protein
MADLRRVGPGDLANYVTLDRHTDRTGLTIRWITRRGSPLANAHARQQRQQRALALSNSAGAGRPTEDDVKNFLDRLSRGLGELKRLTDRTKNALLRDVERRRSAWAQSRLRK